VPAPEVEEARNKAKLSEPASLNGLHNIMVYARASLLSAYTNENRGGHIYTVTITSYTDTLLGQTSSETKLMAYRDIV